MQKMKNGKVYKICLELVLQLYMITFVILALLITGIYCAKGEIMRKLIFSASVLILKFNQLIPQQNSCGNLWFFDWVFAGMILSFLRLD